MKTHKKFISDLRDLLIKNGINVSQQEYTFGNYDDFGNEIKEGIPTLTTNLCEIGFYEKIYFVIILHSDSFSEYFFNTIKGVENLKIYGFKNFKENLYPSIKNYEKILLSVKQEKYFQVQIDLEPTSPIAIYYQYVQIEKIFLKTDAKIMNQLSVNLKNN